MGFGLSTFAQLSKSVSLNNGNLSSILTKTELNTITNLTLSGTIGITDFETMRDLMPVLTVLDMSGANIVDNSIPQRAFEGWPFKTSLISVSIPASVTKIGAAAFRGCSGLTSFSIPSSVTTISMYAFDYCSGLTSISIPASVTSIDNSAFERSSASIAVDDANPNYSSLDGVLFNKDKTLLIHCSTTQTGNYSIPTTVTEIATGAFAGCNKLTSISIPASVTKINTGTFEKTGGTIIVDASNPNFTSLDGVLFLKDKSLLMYCPVTKTGSYTIPSTVEIIYNSAFSDCTQLTSISIPTSVTTIGEYAFQGCTQLTSISIPASVIEVGNEAFWLSSASIIVSTSNPNYSSLDGVLFNKSKSTLIYCPKTKTGSYTIPLTVSTINAYAFDNCTKLTSVSIHASVTSINARAFGACTGLTSVYVYRANPISISSSTFNSSNQPNCTLYVPVGSSSLYALATVWRDFYQIVEGYPTSTNKLLSASSFNIYPNPLTGPLTIDLGEAFDSSVWMTVYNIHGAQMMKQLLVEQKTLVDLSKLLTGSYLIEVDTGNTTQSKILIK